MSVVCRHRPTMWAGHRLARWQVRLHLVSMLTCSFGLRGPQNTQLHIVIALSQYYSYISRELLAGVRTHILGMRTIKTDVPLQRIYLMPTPTSPSGSSLDGRSHPFPTSGDDVTVYATEPIGGMSEEDARKMFATPAWIAASPVSSTTSTLRSHRHSHSHSHAHPHARWHPHSHRHTNFRPVNDEKAPFPA